MNFLIDTHALLWYIQGNKQSSKRVISLIENPENDIFVSQISLWEIVIKQSLNKLKLGMAISELSIFLNKHDFSRLNIKDSHLNTLLNLPFHHRDPFDRMLISQAITEKMTLISDDSKFSGYPVELFKS